MRGRILLFTLRDVSIPQQFIPNTKFSPEMKLRSFGTIFNKDRLASTRRFKRGPQGIRDAHESAFLTLWEETQGSSVNNLSREYAVECLPTAFSAIQNVRLFMEVCSRGGQERNGAGRSCGWTATLPAYNSKITRKKPLIDLHQHSLRIVDTASLTSAGMRTASQM